MRHQMQHTTSASIYNANTRRQYAVPVAVHGASTPCQSAAETSTGHVGLVSSRLGIGKKHHSSVSARSPTEHEISAWDSSRFAILSHVICEVISMRNTLSILTLSLNFFLIINNLYIFNN